MGCHGWRALTISGAVHSVRRRRRAGLPRGRARRRGPRGGHDRGAALSGRARVREPGGLAGSVACLLPSGRWRAMRACRAALLTSVALVACLERCRPAFGPRRACRAAGAFCCLGSVPRRFLAVASPCLGCGVRRAAVLRLCAVPHDLASAHARDPGRLARSSRLGSPLPRLLQAAVTSD